MTEDHFSIFENTVRNSNIERLSKELKDIKKYGCQISF